MVIIAFICYSLTIGSIDRIGKRSDNSTCLGVRAATICVSRKKLRFFQSMAIGFTSVKEKYLIQSTS